MTGPDIGRGTGHLVGRRPALRRWGTDPVVPAVLLTAGALLAAASGTALTWAMVGGLAGYTLSGSV